MKITRLLAMFVLALFTLPAFASTPPAENLNINTSLRSGKSMNVQMFNIEEERTTLTIENLKETTVFYQEMIRKRNGFNRNFNLDKMHDGRYLLKIKQKDQVWIQVIKIDGERMILSKMTKIS